jgi:hypothetical protein
MTRQDGLGRVACDSDDFIHTMLPHTMDKPSDKPKPIPFSEYIAGYPKALSSFIECLHQSKLQILEQIALRFSHALEGKTLDLKAGNERAFLSDILVKTTTEMFAIIGVLRNGAFLPAYHHTRSIFELYAALEYVYSDPAKCERRLEKYVEYRNVARFLHYRDYKRQLSEGKNNGMDCAVAEIEFNELKKREPEWKRIWKLKKLGPEVIEKWHHPATIKQLFEASEAIQNFWISYENACHVTHFSPLGIRLTGLLLIGFPKSNNRYDYRKINMPIVYSILVAQAIVGFLHSSVKVGLIEGVLNYRPDALRADT